MEYAQFHGGERRTYSEMRQKPVPRNAFFSLIVDSPQKRPMSVATDIVDTDWDDDDHANADDIIYDDLIISDDDISPRASIRSADQTTLSSFEDEIRTPRSSNGDQFEERIQGPSGPHLFRSSTDSTRLLATDYDVVLSLSPITPKPRGYEEIVIRPPLPEPSANFRYSNAELNRADLLQWTPEMVAQWMFDAGIGQRWVHRLIENDINGEILLNLKSEDLRELDIPSFGVRMKLWGQIESLKSCPPESPLPTTPIDEQPSREVKREAKLLKSPTGRRQPSIRRQQRQGSAGDAILPSESVSIIGIEQVIPKPHHCIKGKDCKTWKRQEELIANFQRQNPHINMNASGTVLVAGNTENPETARALDLGEIRRPFSDTIQSEVASSDVLGPGGVPPLQYLREATLRNLQSRDPLDNVQQFLNFQQRSIFASDEVPPTPPFEVLSNNQTPHKGLRRLAKLSIPLNQQAQLHGMRHGRSLSESEASQREQYEANSPEQPVCEPYHVERQSPEWETSRNTYRFGTPFSEMDVPVTSVPVGPIARDASQSVPPNMNYRGMDNGANNFRPRSGSRASSRRPSFPVLPAVSEHMIPRFYSQTPSPQKTSPRPSISSDTTARSLQAPPRGQYAWSSDKIEQVVRPGANMTFATPGAANGVSFQGPMKKRKTRLLRHEWQDGYFTLKGTRLNMHKDQAAVDRALEYIDIDDYAIACSSVASTSKLSAAFKAVSISSHSREKSDPVGAFSFQLVPQDKNTARLRKRESAMPSCIPPEGVNGTGKTHHFAVKNRDDRIDWMREMMLAKALKQKGAGFEISVNGNMI